MENKAENMEEGDCNGEGDRVDALTFPGIFSPSYAVGMMSTSRDSLTYNMSHPSRGKLIIINNKKFDAITNLNERRGTDEDAQNLFRVFQKLGFTEIDVHADLKVQEMRDVIKSASKENYTNRDCFVCCILSHGELNIIYGKDGKLSTEELFKPFRGDKCPTLAGKPKLFFIQACQGDKLDRGMPLRRGCDQTDSTDECRIPIHADFLLCSSTIPGFYSWRNTTQGSWFIQALCAVLDAYYDKEDLLSMMTMVNHKVAYYFESYTPHNADFHMKKQIPCITSMLTRKIYFT